MQNQLVEWVEENRGEQSIRKLSKGLSLSHSYVADVLRGKKPVTWGFAATVAEKMGLDYLDAFQMAGLLPVDPQNRG